MRATTDQPASLSLLDGDLLEDLDGIDPTFDTWLTTERERLRDRARNVAEALLREIERTRDRPFRRRSGCCRSTARMRAPGAR